MSTNNSTLLHRTNSPFGDGFSTIHHKTELEKSGRGAKSGRKPTKKRLSDAERKRLDFRRCLWSISKDAYIRKSCVMQVFFGSAIVFHCSLQWIQCWLDMDAGGGSQPYLDMWLLEVDAVSENRLVRWQSPVPVLWNSRPTETKRDSMPKHRAP